MSVCIFCLTHESRVKEQCLYGMHHEYEVEKKPAQPVKKSSKALCTKCGLHPKNPASASNGCSHEYVLEVNE